MTALPIACRNAPAGAAAWWSAGAWQVTPYGLEEHGGHNAISSNKLAKVDAAGLLQWPLEMATIGVADLDSFLAAFPVALALHGYSAIDPAILERSLKAARKHVRRMAYEAKMAAAEVNKLRKKQEKALQKLQQQQEAPMQ